MQEALTDREIITCRACRLVQYRTSNDICRRCKKSLLPEKLEAAAPPTERLEFRHSDPAEIAAMVAASIKTLRLARNLTQAALADLIGSPRTYISKIENDHCLPTLTSLFRIAAALEVDVTALFADWSRVRTASELLLRDPFLAEVATYLPNLTADQRACLMESLCAMNPPRRYALNQSTPVAGEQQ